MHVLCTVVRAHLRALYDSSPFPSHLNAAFYSARYAFVTRTVCWSSVLLLCTLSVVPAAEPPEVSGDPDIAQLIQQLGDRSFQVRAGASRRRCRRGPAARPALEKAARSEDFEVALRAKALLDVFDQLLFVGCAIDISVSKQRVAWDESFDLILTIRNQAAHSSTLPFDVSHRKEQPPAPEAEQVAAVLDLADLLEVVGPDGAPVAFHVDSTSSDPELEAVLRSRADASPTTRLEPGQSFRFQAVDFNRGWGRYPMFRKGTYRITLAYVPQWNDEEFARAGVGGVRSNTVELAITEGAPGAVVSPGAPPRLSLVHEQASVSARLLNCRDVPIWLNVNFGPGGSPYASLRWVVYDGKEWRDCPPTGPSASRTDFSRVRLLEIAPGQELEIGRADLADLRRAAGLNPDQPLFVRAVYSSLCDRAWQRQKKDLPPALQQPLPARLLTTTLAGEPLRID